jgi:hypothetical protein
LTGGEGWPIIRYMRLPTPIRSTTAAFLVALLGVLGTGLPSHHHEGPDPSTGSEHHLVAPDHHSHGTQIVEQDERTPAGPLQLPVLAGAVARVAPEATTAVDAPEQDVPRPMERAPPPGDARAPPSTV